ncbi:MAG: hypothetical protein HYZ28_01310 [Myxococcales bacterium]|nr:hypothetical protein [Myxococcales bacterium]
MAVNSVGSDSYAKYINYKSQGASKSSGSSATDDAKMEEQMMFDWMTQMMEQATQRALDALKEMQND